MPIELHGTEGIQTPGMASASMPTSGGSPIVESGSNSDGEWTRWADGTQHCCFEGTTSYTTSSAWQSGSELHLSPSSQTFTFSIPFLQLQAVIPSARVTSGSLVWAMNTNSAKSNTACSLRLISGRSNGEGVYSYLAAGRWK